MASANPWKYFNENASLLKYDFHIYTYTEISEEIRISQIRNTNGSVANEAGISIGDPLFQLFFFFSRKLPSWICSSLSFYINFNRTHKIMRNLNIFFHLYIILYYSLSPYSNIINHNYVFLFPPTIKLADAISITVQLCFGSR